MLGCRVDHTSRFASINLTTDAVIAFIIGQAIASGELGCLGRFGGLNPNGEPIEVDHELPVEVPEPGGVEQVECEQSREHLAMAARGAGASRALAGGGGDEVATSGVAIEEFGHAIVGAVGAEVVEGGHRGVTS